MVSFGNRGDSVAQLIDNTASLPPQPRPLRIAEPRGVVTLAAAGQRRGAGGVIAVLSARVLHQLRLRGDGPCKQSHGDQKLPLPRQGHRGLEISIPGVGPPIQRLAVLHLRLGILPLVSQGKSEVRVDLGVIGAQA